ncbi:MAG TPA: sulfate adenylyltransferase [Marinilabiliales bacterium]|nr:MAG: sulfate adenylyltransferase [Bacteroidetes bacterium GWA2_40_14]OFX56906.1 MAG: sulfate adenylyltransferase [Bacteroidetes bacterium GWC2_40_13]OFX76213.1 MAG: sulfate adenylyltransferase [Bacteroidetes bacterium GWD2_40_43]OFX95403.1 MAG: sulfate adenylyltransferase [Bacteroidetes bacterium GWE2_40_63]OFY19065.1 MAG: sulfate adenylyltransferase [Bacteroidetes bacterium GWF2_40_13]OFZ24016.1 MAG: sulfate adenylyltransferase [Bacteroidetes bacterium RIFOXYC2_FULL_40_12]HAN00154.1 sulfa
MSLLRFTTAGSVDDGKSTLIGRLLYDSKSIFEDQLSAIEETSKRKGQEEVDLSLLTDGLRAEREQGITIDVAYRYFATPKRKFIIADTPGHIQYTRNMVTGASTANLAIILVDARNGVLEQTLRHTYIAHLLNIPHVVFCINKMDLMGYSQETYETIKKELEQLVVKLQLRDARFIPISAKYGDNVVDRSEHMDWYQGTTLLHLLETIEINQDLNMADGRFPVQYVIRPQQKDHHDYRGYAGRIASGVFKPGDKVKVLPWELASEIKAIDFYGEELDEALPSQSVTVRLTNEIELSRGGMIVHQGNEPTISNTFSADVCWFNEKSLDLSKKYILRHTTNELKCVIKGINFKTNINTYEKDLDDKQIKMNDIANLSLMTAKPIFYDSYRKNRTTGSIILVDEGTNETVAAGMIN